MKLLPSEHITDEERKSGLNLIVKDGLACEAMATLTGGAFLVALAIHLGASNFQIGLLAALPTLASIFQLVGIYLIQKYKNRRTISVYSSILARSPLLLIGFLPFLFTPSVSLNFLILFLFFHYFFGSISGCGWTSWMRDLVPENMLGTYFSNRSRLIQMLNVSLSLIVAFGLDYIKDNYPQFEINTYSGMFIVGGILGVLGVYLLVKTPEPKMIDVQTNLFKLFKNPLKNKNFKNLLIFNSFWAFAINLAAPFFSVYMLKMLNLPLSYVVGFNILSQLTSILFIRIWGRYSDKYSNKSIIRICAPIYLCCILAWTFTTMPGIHTFSIPLLVVIFIFNGISTSGINLSLSNIGMKLAPKEGDAIVYLTTKGMITSLFAGIAPVIGGLFADFFSKRQFSLNLEWKSPAGNMLFQAFDIQQWDFFFLFAFLLGIIALQRLAFVKETGEVRNQVILNEIALELKKQIRTSNAFAGVRDTIFIPFSFFTVMKRKRRINNYKRRKKHTTGDSSRTETKILPLNRPAEGGKKDQSAKVLKKLG